MNEHGRQLLDLGGILETGLADGAPLEAIGDALAVHVATAYRAQWGAQQVLDKFEFGGLLYAFDSTPSAHTTLTAPANRVLAAWGSVQPHVRFGDRRTLRRFPLPAIDRRFDRGHLIALSAGAGDYVNLVPQDPSLNRGWSKAGKRWRALERRLVADPGAFAFVHVHYCDLTDVPDRFDYLVIGTDRTVEMESFSNSPEERS